MVAPQHSKHYSRSGSWQVATVLNPSLHNSLPASQLSTHSREKRERGGGPADQTGPRPEGNPHSPLTAYKSWQEEDEEEQERGRKLPLPPQYVCPSELCKAMPKYARLKARPDTNRNGTPVPFSTAASTEAVNPCSPGSSPRNDLAAGSPRASDSSGRETPRSVLDFPQQSKTPQQAKSASGAASPASPARSLRYTPHITAKSSREPSPPVSTGYQNTPLSTSALRGQEDPPGGAPSPRCLQIYPTPRRVSSRSAATSPTLPIPTVGSKVTGHATPANAMLLRSKLNTLAQSRELMVRMAQMKSTAQGSPLSPANSEEASRLGSLSTPPVALPPTPPVASRARRVRNPHPPAPTLETYEKASPNTHATNAVWNDRRDSSREQTNPRQSILRKSP